MWISWKLGNHGSTIMIKITFGYHKGLLALRHSKEHLCGWMMNRWIEPFINYEINSLSLNKFYLFISYHIFWGSFSNWIQKKTMNCDIKNKSNCNFVTILLSNQIVGSPLVKHHIINTFYYSLMTYSHTVVDNHKIQILQFINNYFILVF